MLPHARYFAVEHESVELEEWEAHEGWQRGYTLRADALGDGRHDKPSISDPQRVQCLGSLAERAVAKHLEVYARLESLVFREKTDLSHEIEVRLIGVPHYGLRVDPAYPDDRRVVGIVIPKGDDPRGCAPGPWAIPGWCFVGDARLLSRQMDISMLRIARRPPEAFSVPQSHLRAMEGLRELIRGADPREVALRWPPGSNARALAPTPPATAPELAQIALF